MQTWSFVLEAIIAGAMMYLVVLEMLPDALETRRPTAIAWSFMAGFGLMALVQTAL